MSLFVNTSTSRTLLGIGRLGGPSRSLVSSLSLSSFQLRRCFADVSTANSKSEQPSSDQSNLNNKRGEWPSIAIVGGGVAGLSFANLLVRR